MTFVSRRLSHNAKFDFAVNKQNMKNGQKLAQSNLIETMILNKLTGLEPKLGHVVRSSYSPDTYFTYCCSAHQTRAPTLVFPRVKSFSYYKLTSSKATNTK